MLPVVLSNKWMQYMHTFVIMLQVFCMGLTAAVIGCTMIDLKEIYDSTIDNVSHLITARGVGSLIGAASAGLLYDRFHTLRLSVLLAITSGIGTIFLPSSASLSWAFVAAAVCGFSFSALDSGCTVWLINIWPKHSGPFVQAYHFFFGVGGFISPLITEPFLSVTASNATQMNVTIINELEAQESRIAIPYALFGGVLLFGAIIILILHCIDKTDIKPPKTTDDQTSKKQKRLSLVFIGLLSVYMLVYVALECCTSLMLGVFAVNCDLHFTKSLAAYLLSVYWATFTCGRIGAIMCAFKFKSMPMLLLDHFCIFVSLGLLFFLGNTSSLALWIGTALMGLGQSGMYGSATTWFMEHETMTNIFMSYTIIGSCIGAALPPFLVGRFMDSNPIMLINVLIGLAVLLTLILFIMWRVSRNKPKCPADIQLL